MAFIRVTRLLVEGDSIKTPRTTWVELLDVQTICNVVQVELRKSESGQGDHSLDFGHSRTSVELRKTETRQGRAYVEASVVVFHGKVLPQPYIITETIDQLSELLEAKRCG